MKQFINLSLFLIIFLAFSGCRRDYKVVHARIPVDTLAHDDIEKATGPSVDEPLIDIPDAPQESDYNKVTSKDRQDYDDYMKGL